MKVIVADDHFLVLDGLEVLLSTFDFVDSINIANNYAELKNELNQTKFDLLLLDIDFGNYDGRKIFHEIKENNPDLKIIALTSYTDPEVIKSTANAGFDGYLLKTDQRNEIQTAMLKVMKGEKYFSPKTQAAFFETVNKNEKIELTERETEILELIVKEKTTKEIAEILFLSEKTIESHRGNIMVKLNVRNIAGMVRKAITENLVKIT